MKSARPKVLHEIAGRSMLAHVLAAVAAAGARDIAARRRTRPRRCRRRGAQSRAQRLSSSCRRSGCGTAHAVLAAREAIAAGYDDVLIVYADIPLVRARDAGKPCATAWREGAAVAALGFAARDPTGYGRLIEKDGAPRRDPRA